MDQFVEQLRQVSPLSDEIVGQLLEEMKEVSFAKGELSIREGERDPFVWFVKTGLVRAFVEREGKDISLWFASDSEVINFVYRDISAYNVQMVENTTLLRIPKTKLGFLCKPSYHKHVHCSTPVNTGNPQRGNLHIRLHFPVPCIKI